ncbi:hypothetical protein [Vulcanisaeta moutnovskia]|uniref:hypothetical protein n=1 Tax=Vulcanisaeta moutnovskia TaxID=985052 RepID=UPI00064E1F1A|nr:hypothetical protein [Vulcanisaeta moutnovskia]
MYMHYPRLLLIMVLVFSIAAVLLTMLIVSGQQLKVSPKPMIVINRTDYQIDYYELSTGEPTLVFRGMYDGSPVPITVSLFAFTPGKIYVVGYYYGSNGVVTVNLTGSLVMHIANKWLGRYGDLLWPSLIAFVTYTVGNKSWTVITAIPYDPSWITSRRPIYISITTHLDKVKPAILRPIMHAGSNVTNSGSGIEPTVITGGGGQSYFGYLYVGSCLGNSEVNNVANQIPTDAALAYWVPVQCDELEGPIPIMFIGWSQDAIQNSISYISIGDFAGTAQKGSGLYGVVNATDLLSPQLYSVYLVGPTITFNNNYNMYVYYGSFVGGYVNNEGNVYDIYVKYGSSTSSTLSGTVLTYTVPGQGFVYLGLYGNISYVSYEEYQLGQPMYEWANGTLPLSISPSEISGNDLFIYPGLDTGNGPITGMFTAILYSYYDYGQLPISLLDGYSYPTNKQCSNAPSAAQADSNQITYTLTSITNTYSPNPIGWAYLAGSLVAGIFLVGAPAWLSITAGSALTIIGMFIPTNLFNSNQFAFQASVTIAYTGPFYVTFLGTQQVSNGQGSQTLYPMGIIINETNYYLGVYSCQG